MSHQVDQNTKRSFFRMMEWPSALGLGTLAAFLFSIKQINPHVEFKINFWSWLILIAGTVGAWFLTRGLFRALEEGDQEESTVSRPGSPRSEAEQGRRRKMIVFCTILGGGILGSLAYSLTDIPESKRFDVIFGITAALLFVAMALYGFWRLVQFLERHGDAELERQAQEDAKRRGDEGWQDSSQKDEHD